MTSPLVCLFWASAVCVLVSLARDIGRTGDIFTACNSRQQDHIHVPQGPDCRHRMLEELPNFQRPVRDGPVHAPCNLHWHTRRSACKSLKPFKRIVFAGDSLTRQIHDGLLIVLRSDLAYGGLSTHLHPREADACSCDSVQHHSCKLSTAGWQGINVADNSTVWHSVQQECGIEVELFHMYEGYTDTGTVQAILSRVQESHDSQLFLGALPLHHHCHGCSKLDADSTIRNIMHPLLAGIDTSRVVFGLMHAHENDKVPIQYKPGQSIEDVLAYNQKMQQCCEAQNVPVFDPFAATSNLSTVDGVHHSTAINVIKAQVYLNHLTTLI